MGKFFFSHFFEFFNQIFHQVGEEDVGLSMRIMGSIPNFSPLEKKENPIISNETIETDFNKFVELSSTNCSVYKLPFELHILSLPAEDLKTRMHTLTKLIFFPVNEERYFMISFFEDEITLVLDKPSLHFFLQEEKVQFNQLDTTYVPLQLCENQGFYFFFFFLFNFFLLFSTFFFKKFFNKVLKHLGF